MGTTLIVPNQPSSPLPESTGGGNVLLLAVAPTATGTAKHIIFAVKAWDPTKHPKGHKGLFIDTPDKIKATNAKPGDTIVTKAGKTFLVEKQTEKGVKVNPVALDSGEVQPGYTVLGNDIDVAVVEAGKGPGSVHVVGELQPGTHIKTKAGKRFKISKHGKWTTVYPVDDKGNVVGKHTVLPPDTTVTVDAPDVSATVDQGLLTKLKTAAQGIKKKEDAPEHQVLKDALNAWLDVGGDGHQTYNGITSNFEWHDKLPIDVAAAVAENVPDNTPAGWVDAFAGVLGQAYGMDFDVSDLSIDKTQSFISAMEKALDDHGLTDVFVPDKPQAEAMTQEQVDAEVIQNVVDFLKAKGQVDMDDPNVFDDVKGGMGYGPVADAQGVPMAGWDFVSSFAPFWDEDIKAELASAFDIFVQQGMAKLGKSESKPKPQAAAKPELWEAMSKKLDDPVFQASMGLYDWAVDEVKAVWETKKPKTVEAAWDSYSAWYTNIHDEHPDEDNQGDSYEGYFLDQMTAVQDAWQQAQKEPPATKAPQAIDKAAVALAAMENLYQSQYKPYDATAQNIYDSLYDQIPGIKAGEVKGASGLQTVKDSYLWQTLHSMFGAELDERVEQAIAIKQAQATPKETVEEILPTKLPKVPKGYPAGTGQHTYIEIVDHTGGWIVRRMSEDGNTAQALGTYSSKTAARKAARNASADHEQIQENAYGRRSMKEAYDTEPFMGEIMVNVQGHLVQVVTPPEDEVVTNYNGTQTTLRRMKVARLKAGAEEGTTETHEHHVWLTMNQGFARFEKQSEADAVIASLLKAGQTHQLTVGLEAARHFELKAGILELHYHDELRKARPERYSPYLHYDWSPDTLVGASTNEALKALSSIGYREIKPRLKDRLRVINAYGKRLELERVNNQVTAVHEAAGATIHIDGTARDVHAHLEAALNQGADLSTLDPRLGPPEIATSHVRTMLYDLAVGKQNGVGQALGKAGKTGKQADVKVKTDDAYRAQIEDTGTILPVDNYLALAERPPYVVTIPRAGALNHFKIPFGVGDPATDGDGWRYEVAGNTLSVDADLTFEEATALSLIMKRSGVARLIAQPLDDDPLVEHYLDELKADDPLTGARKLAAAMKQYQEDHTGPLAKMESVETRNYLLNNYFTFENVARPIYDALDTEQRKRAEALRAKDMKDEIAARRAEEGTVASAPGTAAEFDLPVWEEVEFEQQTFADIQQLVNEISGSPRPSREEVHNRFRELAKVVLADGYSGGVEEIETVEVVEAAIAASPDASAEQLLAEYSKQKATTLALNLESLLYQELVTFDKVSDPVPHDVPAFYSGGYVKDGVLMHSHLRTTGKVELEHDQRVMDLLLAQGAVEEENRDPINPGYNGTAKVHDGRQLTLTELDPTQVATREQIEDALLDTVAELPSGAIGTMDLVVQHGRAANAASLDDYGRAYAAWLTEGAAGDDWKDQLTDHEFFSPTQAQVLEIFSIAEQRLNQKAGQRRIEYVMHDQASWNAGGAPTSQRGVLRLVGFTPEGAAQRLRDLGVLGDLEPEVPFKAILRSSRRYGPPAPLHPDYVTGRAELPATKARITHGITSDTSVDSLLAILNSGGLMAIAERHRVGILSKSKGVSISGDIRSGIDHGVFCTLDGGGACGSGSSVKFIMKPHAYLRRDICLAPYDYGGCETRYPQYRSYLNGLQSAVGEPKTNLYAPASPAVRQKHIDDIAVGSGSEYNIGPQIPIEDMEAIQVPDQAAADQVNELLDGMLTNGQITERPVVVIGYAEGNSYANQGTEGGKPGAATAGVDLSVEAMTAAGVSVGDVIHLFGEDWKVMGNSHEPGMVMVKMINGSLGSLSVAEIKQGVPA